MTPVRSALGVGLALGAAALLLLVVPEACTPIQTHTSSPSEPQRDAEPEPTLSAMVIGTIDREHLTQQGYPFSKIGDAFDAFKPDLVLLQVRPDPYKKHELEDAPLEMTYVNEVAGQRGVDTEPIDWFRELELALPAPPPDNADSDAFKRETAFLDGFTHPTFEEANSKDTAKKLLAGLNAKRRYQNGNALWEKRVAWIEHNVDEAMARHQARRVLVVVGALFRPEIEMHLETQGAVLRNAAELVAKATEARETGAVPATVLTAWKQELNRLKDKLDQAPKKSPERASIAARIQVLDAAVEHRGACCVPQGTFDPPASPGK